MKAIISEGPGLRALTSWAQVWADAVVLEHMACFWRGVLGVPLRKGEQGEDVRPILISEALMAVPYGCLKTIVQAKAVKLLLHMEFGVGVTSGAETMVQQAQAMIKLSPTQAFCALDVRNAFGEMSRRAVLEETVKELPELAPFLMLLWGDAGTPIYVPADANTWERILVYDGLSQGHALASLLFCACF